jgi:hypothetical protein
LFIISEKKTVKNNESVMRFMADTVGTLNLKIARLQYYLQVVQQRKRLSLSYPQYYTYLVAEEADLENQLRELMRRKEELIQNKTEEFWKGDIYGNPDGQKSVPAFNQGVEWRLGN